MTYKELFIKRIKHWLIYSILLESRKIDSVRNAITY
jgi:hypothetical protein